MSKTLFGSQFIKYCKLISDTYSINYEELISLWENRFEKEPKIANKVEKNIEKNIEKDIEKEIKKEIKKDTQNEIKKETKKDPKVETKKDIKQEIDSENSGCPYTYTKGQKAGQECGVKAKNGGKYCSVHKKYENTEPKERKNVPITIRTQKAIDESKSKIEKSIQPKKRTEYSTFRKNNELNLYVNEATNFALKSMQTKLVIGKIIDNKLQPLTDKDKEECLRYNMKYE